MNIEFQYLDLLRDILSNGVKKEDRTGTGTISVFGRQLRHKMSEGFPLLTTKKMYVKGIITELIWFLRGDTNIKYLVENNCNIWNGDAYKKYLQTYQFSSNGVSFNPENGPWDIDNFIRLIKEDNWFASIYGDLGPIYGKQWRNWSNIGVDWQNKSTDGSMSGECWTTKPIDQIANLIDDLKNNPDSRRLMVNAWNVAEINQMTLPPCHYSFQLYTRELSLKERNEEFRLICNTHEELNEMNIPKRYISLMWNQRSCDVPLGIPFNIASYALLLEILAKEVNMVSDELICNLGDCHIYNNQIEGCEEQIKRINYSLPNLKIANNINIDNYDSSHFEVLNYQSHSSIKFPLSN